MTHLNFIPDNAKTKHIAALGATGSGKTSAIKVGLVEPLLTQRERVLIIDPTGAWWGPRLDADGKRNGFPIYIFGGDHGDYPLRARDAGVLAETFGTSSDSAVFDTSLMTVAERTAFFTEFAEAIRRKNRGPLHLIIDEAHLFMPQAGAASGGAVPAMLHAGNNLVSLGRSRGLRITLISQRPAKLHKDSLTQVQSLVAMRLMAPQDRKAIADWIADQADPTRGKEIIASLPTLKPGEAWIWSPQDNALDRVHFPLPRTYDSSKAPTEADPKALNLAPVDLAALQGRLTALETERKANDPAVLRKRIIELEQQASRQAGIDPADHERLVRASYQNGISAGRQHIVGMLKELRAAIEKAETEAQRLADQAYDEAKGMERPLNIIVPTRTAIIHHKDGARQEFKIPPRQNGAGETHTLPKGERAVLIAAAQHDRGVTRQQLTVLTGYKRSTRDAYIQRLRERGHLIEENGRILATHAGCTALGDDYERLPTGAALRSHVLSTLPEGEARILSILLQEYPNPVDRDTISEATGYKRSTRDAYLQRLDARELIDTSNRALRASANLFD